MTTRGLLRRAPFPYGVPTMSEAFVSLFPGQVLPQVPEIKAPTKTSEKRPARARDKSGEFQADDPATPDVNEAFIEQEDGNPEA